MTCGFSVKDAVTSRSAFAASMEQNMQGHFERKVPDFEIPSDMTYIVSWVKE